MNSIIFQANFNELYVYVQGRSHRLNLVAPTTLQLNSIHGSANTFSKHIKSKLDKDYWSDSDAEYDNKVIVKRVSYFDIIAVRCVENLLNHIIVSEDINKVMRVFIWILNVK